MVREVVEYLATPGARWFVDATLGSGGHAEAILDVVGPEGRLVGLDRDARALARARHNLSRFGDRVVLREANFRNLAATVLPLVPDGVDGVVMDLGVSSEQLDEPGAGFSYRASGPLSLTMEPDARPDARDLVNTLEEADLVRILEEYGDVRRARGMARSLIRRRPLATTLDLVAAAADAGLARPEELSRITQALRIAVNREFEALEAGLADLLRIVKPGGVAAVISYHSGEDRIVKRFFTPVVIGKPLPWTPDDRAGRRWESLTRGARKPSREEVGENVRSRSARLRAARRNAG